jgi:hypothetical protein
MADFLSPDVRIRERDITEVIPSVTSAVGGIVIHAEKGPVNVRRALTSTGDLEDVYGRPQDFNYTHWFTAEAFLKQSDQLWAVRTEDDTKAVAGLTYGVSASAGGNLILSDETTKLTETFPLDYSDIKEHEAKKDYTLPEGSDVGELDHPSNNLFTNDVYHFYGVGPGTYYDDISVTVVNSSDWNLLLDLKNELVEAVNQDELNEIASKYYNGDPGTPSTTASPGTPANDYLANSLIKYDVLTPPPTGTTDWTIDNSTLNILTNFENGPDELDEGVLIVWDEFGNNVESYVFSHDPDKRDGNGNRMFGPDLVNPREDAPGAGSSYIYFFIGHTRDGASGEPVITTRRTFLGGADQLTGEVTGSSLADLTGEIMEQWTKWFTNPEDLEVDLLLDADYPDSVKRYIDSIAREVRLDCMAVLNVPLNTVLNPSNFKPISNPYTTMRNYVSNTLNVNSSYSAIYGNWFKVFDRFAEKERWVPVTGFAAAVMAFTDFSDAQWFAPAGLNRGIISNVVDVAVNPNKGQRDIIYYARINPVVKFTGEGIVIWGQKTLLSRASAFDRINVRRLFLHLEKSIKKAARFFLFEFNDSYTRSRFRGVVNPFLSTVQARRGVFDYLVVCDETNNPPQVVDKNEFNAEILVKPTRVAEFIRLTFTAVATGIEFNEVVERL